MDADTPLGRLVSQWAGYLERHGHQVKEDSDTAEVILSSEAGGRKYRWLLGCVDGDSLLLTALRRKCIRRQRRLARNAGQRCYLVVKFGQPESKLLVMPATEAVEARRVNCDKGGIPWDR